MPIHTKKQKGKNFDLANNSELYDTAANAIVVCSLLNCFEKFKDLFRREPNIFIILRDVYKNGFSS